MLKIHKPKWVKRAGCYVVTSVEPGDKKSIQKEYWFSTEQDAINKYKELNDF